MITRIKAARKKTRHSNKKPDFYIQNKEKRTVGIPGTRNGSHICRNRRDKWDWDARCEILYRYMEGEKFKDSANDFIRTNQGGERIIDKMMFNYGTILKINRNIPSVGNLIKLRLASGMKYKEAVRIQWGTDTRWECGGNREGHPVTENEYYWVKTRLHFGHKTPLFSGMSWKRLAEETGRTAKECKKLFKYLCKTQLLPTLFQG